MRDVREIIAVLDRDMEKRLIRKKSDIEVNWFMLNEPFDFDRIRILSADDFDVEQFVMMMRNDHDDERIARMKSIPVSISSGPDLSKNKINLLKMSFGSLSRI